MVVQSRRNQEWTRRTYCAKDPSGPHYRNGIRCGRHADIRHLALAERVPESPETAPYAR